MDDTIRLLDIFKAIKKRWKLIVLITFAAALVSGIISYSVLTPVYQASTQILVNQKNSENQLDISQINSNVDLINTYSVIIKSPIILDKVINNLDLKQNVEQLNQNITVNSQDNSQVFTLTVKDNNAGRSVKIANTVSEIFQKEIQGIMNVDNVSILAKAELIENPTPIKPDPLLNIAIAIVVGLMAGIGLVFPLEYLDNTLKNGKDVETYLEMPVLGSIEKIQQNDKKGSKIQRMGVETLESYSEIQR